MQTNNKGNNSVQNNTFCATHILIVTYYGREPYKIEVMNKNGFLLSRGECNNDLTGIWSFRNGKVMCLDTDPKKLGFTEVLCTSEKKDQVQR